MPHRFRLIAAFVVLLLAWTLAPAQVPPGKVLDYDIPAQPLASALQQLAEKATLQLLYSPADLQGVATRGIKGSYTAREAIERLLEGTGLTASFNGESAVAIKPRAEERRGARVSDASAVRGMPEILVTRSRLLNMDIRRTQDDVQPYIIFDRESIATSGATNLEDFFKLRLPQNAQAGTSSQISSFRGNVSEVNLRGLGSNQTLILIDGHRAPNPMVGGGNPLQTDINGLPLAAIERIEVLPSTASGIYGGSATGGVINIILRRDYSGLDIKVTYDNSFSSDSAIRRIDVSSGFNLEQGRTNVLLAGSYSDANLLLMQDRDFVQRGRAAILANNPANILNAANPPLGATTNIRSVNGSPLCGPGTSYFTFVPAGYAGGGGRAPLCANAGQYNFDLAPSAQSLGARSGLRNAATIEAIIATVQRDFTTNLRAFVEVGATNNIGHMPIANITQSFTIAANAPNNPFGQAIRATVPFTNFDTETTSTFFERRVVGGFVMKLPADWKAEADYTWHRMRFQYRQPPPALLVGTSGITTTGAIDVLRDTSAFPLTLSEGISYSSITPLLVTLKDAAIRASGPFFGLPGGPAVASVLVERRDEGFAGGVEDVGPNLGGAFSYGSRSQTVSSAYAELKLPAISAPNRIPGVHELEFQVAGRRDDYTIHGVTGSIGVTSTAPILRPTNKFSSSNPTLGLRYEPIPDLTLRASYGTGFLPPSVSQLAPIISTGPGFSLVVDPQRGGASTQVFNVMGIGNPDLKPEESKSRSIGVILAPRMFPGSRFSADYTRIDKTDNIVILTAQQVVDNEALLPGRVTRGPVPAGDPFAVGPITALNFTPVNIATARVEAIDYSFDYKHNLDGIGSFDFFALATRQLHYKTQLIPAVPIVENVGITTSFPLKLRINAGLTWRLGPWAAGWTARYYDSYISSTNATIALNQGNGGRVPSQVYHDAWLTWTAPAGMRSGWLADTEIQVGIRNVFNTEPPFDASRTSNFYSPYGDARLASYYISFRKSLQNLW